ncbi:hypothetical protein H4219_000427 [Mycoemilia scoparia]|uniref:Uncharacterized protein n=1 Tax=Mycoemilia scoparia TaxID=417184 RepID=A0A9W8A926_9FUNG|nr:hypothetical protein H4219_000427 [Mycoemilia scoparia]
MDQNNNNHSHNNSSNDAKDNVSQINSINTQPGIPVESAQKNEQNSPVKSPRDGGHGPTSPDNHFRYRKLQAILDRSLSSVIDSFKLEDMIAALPELARDIPDILKDTHQQLSNYIHNSANDDFSSIIMQYDIRHKFDELDDLIAQAKIRHHHAPSLTHTEYSTLNPDNAVKVRATRIKKQEIERLTKLVDEVSD